MSRIITLTSTTNSATLQIDDEESVTIMSPVTIYQDDSCISFLVDEMSYSLKLADSITIDGVAFSGTLSQLKTAVQATMPTSGGGATEVTVYQLKTVLTDAQIKALPTTPVELVPAPGAGKLILLDKVVYRRTTLVANYTNIDELDAIYIRYEGGVVPFTGWTKDNASGYDQLTNLLANVVANQEMIAMEMTIPTSDPSGYVYPSTIAISSVNKAIQIAGSTERSSNKNWTGGDPANTLEVTVFYSIVDL